MPSPPKHPSVRARRNSPTSKEIVRAEPLGTPPLPQRYVVTDGERKPAEWHPNAVAVWESIWDSEMVDEFLRVDIGTFIRLLDLETKYWEKSERDERGVVTLNEQIQSIIKESGLTVMRRRVLGLVIASTEESQSRTQAMKRQPRPVDAVQGQALTLPPSSIIEDDPDELFS